MLTAFIQIAALCVTFYGLKTWRFQLVGKRHFEIAEETVLAAYKVKDDLEWIRTDAYLTNEAEERPRVEGEQANQQRNLDRYYIPLKRSREANDDFATLAKCRLLCTVHFGEATREPFQRLYAARAKVVSAALTLSDLARSGHLENLPVLERRGIEARIWGVGDDNDADAVLIRDAVAAIEQICRPHLVPPNDIADFISAARRVVRRLYGSFVK